MRACVAPFRADYVMARYFVTPKQRFWRTNVGGSVCIGVISLVLARNLPWRWGYWSLAFLIPLAVCSAASSRVGTAVGWRSRAFAGMLHSVGLLVFFVSDPTRATIPGLLRWLSCSVPFATAFTLTTWAASTLFSPGRDIGEYCEECGYNLHGLRTPRCPECGTHFDPSRLE